MQSTFYYCLRFQFVKWQQLLYSGSSLTHWLPIHKLYNFAALSSVYVDFINFRLNTLLLYLFLWKLLFIKYKRPLIERLLWPAQKIPYIIWKLQDVKTQLKLFSNNWGRSLSLPYCVLYFDIKNVEWRTLNEIERMYMYTY